MWSPNKGLPFRQLNLNKVSIVKLFFKIIGYSLLAIVALVVIAVGYIFISAKIHSNSNLSKLGLEARKIIVDGFAFRELNKNGKLNV
jgi:hypothetical protein